MFDTTVFIDHLRGRSTEATNLIEQAINGDFPAAFSILTDAELWAGVQDKKDIRAHRILLSRLTRLNLTLSIARRAGQLRRIYKTKNLHIVDALIAATAEDHRLPIYTNNINHFNFITTIITIQYHP